MRGTNRKRALLFSGSVILLCLTIVVGMTWALFTDTQKVNHLMKAGDLDITLKRVALTKTTIGEYGYLDRDVEIQKLTDDPVDFTNTVANNGRNVFAMADNEVLVPGSEFTATMRIENHSDVAFGYWIEIVCSDATKASKLAEQVEVTITLSKDSDGDGNPDTFNKKVGEGLKIGKADDLISTVGAIKDANTANDINSDTFTVNVLFKDLGYTFDANDGLSSPNDDAMGQTIDFDLVVYAIQVTDAT